MLKITRALVLASIVASMALGSLAVAQKAGDKDKDKMGGMKMGQKMTHKTHKTSKMGHKKSKRRHHMHKKGKMMAHKGKMMAHKGKMMEKKGEKMEKKGK